MAVSTRSRVILLAAVPLLGAAAFWFGSGGADRGDSAEPPLGRRSMTDSPAADLQGGDPAVEGVLDDMPERALVVEDETPTQEQEGSADTAAVSILVTRIDTGEPVGNCGVRLSLRDRAKNSPPYVGDERTDDTGRCTIEAPLGAVLLVAAGGARWERGRELGEATEELEALALGVRVEVHLVLPGGLDTDFWGRVVDEATREPLAGARVMLQSGRGENFALPAPETATVATADGNGLFRLRVASWRRSATYALEHAGYGTGFFLPDPDHPAPEGAFVYPLRSTATLRIRVFDGGVAGFADGGDVVLTTKAYELAVPDSSLYISGSDPRWSAPLDAGGRCELIVPARIPLHAKVIGGERAEPVEAPLTLEPGETREVEWRFGEGTLVVGRLLDQEDKPVKGKEIWITRRILAGDAGAEAAFFYDGDARKVHAKTDTDGEGRFRFDDIPAGLWWVGPMASRASGSDSKLRARSVAPLATGIEIAGEARREVELRTWRGLGIRGRIVDPFGAPAPKERVSARPTEMGGSMDAISDSDGAFTLGPLVPGEYKIHSGVFSKYARAEPVLARAGDEGVVLRLREPGSLHGIVTDPARGGPVPARLWVSGRSSGARAGASAKEDGVFSKAGLSPGLYDIAASTPDGLAGYVLGVEVSAGEDTGPVRVEVKPGARVTVRYTGPTTYANFTVYAGEAPVALDGIHTGTSATHIVPAGPLRVHVKTRNELERTVEVDLAAGEEREVVFEF